MASAGKIIFNPKNCQLINFVQTTMDTAGKLLEMKVTFHPKSIVPPLHYHPFQTEFFRIISGELTVRTKSETFLLKQGDTLEIPPNTSHSMWNHSPQKTIVNWQVQPALQTEYFLETLFGLAGDNKTNSSGVPSFLQKILTANKYRDSLRLTNPPFFFQKMVFALVSPIAAMCGFKPDYERYFT